MIIIGIVTRFNSGRIETNFSNANDIGEAKTITTANSERMWELGVNSFEEGKGYGQAALGALVKEVQRRGKVPYCGTALSHCASQNISLRAGFVPAFCELRSVKIECE